MSTQLVFNDTHIYNLVHMQFAVMYDIFTCVCDMASTILIAKAFLFVIILSVVTAYYCRPAINESIIQF